MQLTFVETDTTFLSCFESWSWPNQRLRQTEFPVLGYSSCRASLRAIWTIWLNWTLRLEETHHGVAREGPMAADGTLFCRWHTGMEYSMLGIMRRAWWTNLSLGLIDLKSSTTTLPKQLQWSCFRMPCHYCSFWWVGVPPPHKPVLQWACSS